MKNLGVADGKFIFKAINDILSALSIVNGMNNEGSDRTESGKMFQVLLLSRNTSNCLNNDISLLKHMCKPMSIPTCRENKNVQTKGESPFVTCYH